MCCDGKIGNFGLGKTIWESREDGCYFKELLLHNVFVRLFFFQIFHKSYINQSDFIRKQTLTLNKRGNS